MASSGTRKEGARNYLVEVACSSGTRIEGAKSCLGAVASGTRIEGTKTYLATVSSGTRIEGTKSYLSTVALGTRIEGAKTYLFVEVASGTRIGTVAEVGSSVAVFRDSGTTTYLVGTSLPARKQRRR